ncbi:MAG: DUF3298 domain-containing protein [Anaerolineaceae bacterium]|nr:DUF3298 domain-containing protein [Anaerolineaceae bacterium]
MHSKRVNNRVMMILLAGALILPACLFTSRGGSSPTETPSAAASAIPETRPASTEIEQSATLEAPTAAAATIEKKKLEGAGEDPKYTIEVNYPVIAGAEVFNQASQAIAERVVNAFKGNLETYPPIDDPNLTSYSSVNMNYTVLQNTPGVVSVYYQIDEYYRGAAHPAHYSAALNYDVRNQKVLTLGDLFQPGADYLKLLSDYAIKDLTGEEWFLFPEGALPKAENYRNWNLTPDGLQITFDPYEVAPYAAGFINVLVPYSVLREISNPQGVLVWE